MNKILSSQYLHFFYIFFAVSFLPFIIIQLTQEAWLYSLFYRENGIAENMTMVFYLLSTGFSGLLLYYARPRHILIWGAFLFSVFMLGEETRWGLVFFSENLNQYKFASVQDLIQFAVFHTPSELSSIENLIVVTTRISLFVLVIVGLGVFWLKRHNLYDYTHYLKTSFAPLILFYIVLLSVALLIEFFAPIGVKPFIFFEETFELNAALIWFITTYLAYKTFKPNLIKQI